MSVHDFDLHGLVRVRLLDATARERDMVERQLGPLQADPASDADIIVRFVDRATTLPVTYTAVAETGFNDEGFFVLRGKGGVDAKAMLPFDQIGRRPQILCERGMPSVPHLLAIVNLTALTKGVLPLHASAFCHDSLGVLVTGWAKGGKTESLLAAARSGGSYVGDEWVYLTRDRQMLGLPEPVRLWGWHLRQLDVLKARPHRERVRLSSWRAVTALTAAVVRAGVPGSSMARRGLPVLQRQAYLQIPPAELFGRDRLTLRAPLDAPVLVLTHSSSEFIVERAGRREISTRMLASLTEERSAFLAHYRQFRFGFPDRSSEAVETATDTEARLLSELFDGRPAARVVHPYPCDIAVLGDAVLSAAREIAALTAAHDHVRAR